MTDGPGPPPTRSLAAAGRLARRSAAASRPPWASPAVQHARDGCDLRPTTPIQSSPRGPRRHRRPRRLRNGSEATAISMASGRTGKSGCWRRPRAICVSLQFATTHGAHALGLDEDLVGPSRPAAGQPSIVLEKDPLQDIRSITDLTSLRDESGRCCTKRRRLTKIRPAACPFGLRGSPGGRVSFMLTIVPPPTWTGNRADDSRGLMSERLAAERCAAATQTQTDEIVVTIEGLRSEDPSAFAPTSWADPQPPR